MRQRLNRIARVNQNKQTTLEVTYFRYEGKGTGDFEQLKPD